MEKLKHKYREIVPVISPLLSQNNLRVCVFDGEAKRRLVTWQQDAITQHVFERLDVETVLRVLLLLLYYTVLTRFNVQNCPSTMCPYSKLRAQSLEFELLNLIMGHIVTLK